MKLHTALRGIAAATLAILLTVAAPVRAEERIWATGRVLDSHGNPLPNALVAVYDDSNRVVDYTRSDARGEYALAVPRKCFHLRSKRSAGFIAQVAGSVARFAAGGAGFVAMPIRAGLHAITSSQAASFTDPLTRGGIAAGTAVADRVLGAMTPRQHHAVPKLERQMPGALLVRLYAAGTNDIVGVTHVYWMQDEVEDRHNRHTIAAWLDDVQLTQTGSDTASHFESNLLRITSARLEPGIASIGDTVHVTANVKLPSSPHVAIQVVARNMRTGRTYGLTEVRPGTYESQFVIDKKFPDDDQSITILAYPAASDRAGRRKEVEREIDKLGMWDARRPYIYDPMLTATRNRADLTLTVVRPSRDR